MNAPGRFVAGKAPVGEIRCEGLRPGAATLRAKVRVRALNARGTIPSGCYCTGRWEVAMQVVMAGQESRRLEGLSCSKDIEDRSCQRGPDVEQDLPVTVGADGRVRARIELRGCDRDGPTTCLFLRGTGFRVVQ